MWELKYDGHTFLTLKNTESTDYAVKIHTDETGAILTKQELLDLIQHLLQYYMKAEGVE